jgi:hypothetical protein
MEEYQGSNHKENDGSPAGAGPNRWLTFVLVALLGITAVAFVYGYHQQSVARDLTMKATTADAAKTQMQTQLNALTAKLNELTAAQNAAQSSAPSSTSPVAAGSGAAGNSANTMTHPPPPAIPQARDHKDATCQRRAPWTNTRSSGSAGRAAKTVEGDPRRGREKPHDLGNDQFHSR